MELSEGTTTRTFDRAKIRQAVRQILEAIGEDPDREGLLETPDRVARMYFELTSGMDTSIASQISCEFLEEKAGLVLVRDINFASTCEHHMLPFTGVAHVAYLPREGRITGLSKLARVVEVASKRLQVQERLTAQIADAIEDTLNPLGVFVMVEATHSCMVLRGIKKPGSKTITMDSRGVYLDDKDSRNELLTLLSRP
ncbi:MAG: GTP cyclohydrolase I FolE [Candidatus Obscuribacter sp.]|nr:GTP cyclohydrolase I FolE [Candidatus Obscuribacter sp.]MBK7837325.1 GTP cyclohydrolase I FolE [Candidatus Obscuribacter sp.]MBK9206148.1 GTP cyclohydrolase I FolE [Candidatus Obscuribacter sp.]MBK9618062.1 GTP cyclohydrolase I FolE [Candidatus Obscuribacter sp.]MBK9770293.1 GTP cyclohydrolase I FolE [Candidatus Obscuribacter sp.]